MSGPLPEQHAQILAQKLADGQLALFVGAGLSLQAVAKDGSGRKLPLWKELAECVAAACHEDLATYNGNVLDLFDAIVYGQSRAELEGAVGRLLDDEGFEPSEAHNALAALPWASVYTTNYDRLLARALKKTPIGEEDHYDRLQLSSCIGPRLFHVHGTLEQPHTLTREDYRLWPEKHPRAYHEIEHVLLHKTVLFVGYSLSDPHLADGLLPVARKVTRDREKRLYAWMWQIPQNQVQLFDRRDKIEAVPISRDEDWAAAFRQVAACLREHSGKVVVPLPKSDPYAYDRQQYMAAIEARYGYANLQGLYVGGVGYARTDISLEEVFVEPDLAIVPPAAVVADDGEPLNSTSLRVAVLQRAIDGEAVPDRQGAPEQAVRRDPASRVLARTAKLLIVGAPGEGKSTLLRRVLMQAAAKWREEPVAQPFPVLVKLADWQAEEGPSEGRLARYVESRLPKMGEISSQAVVAWAKGPVLWLLDGIDEIRDPCERSRLVEEVQAATALRPDHRWVIATRPAGEPRGGLGGGWTRAVLPSLSEPQVEEILARWSRVLEKKEGLKLDIWQVAGDLRRDAGLRQVRSNALLLTLAILFFKNQRRLPRDRWEFYAAADTSLRDSWVAHRIRESARFLPGDWLPELLDHLALEGMIDGRVLFDRTTLRIAARSILAARGYFGGDLDKEAALFLIAAEDLIGVLVAQAPDRFGFLHLTFQEFYAARAAARRGEEDRTKLIAMFWDHPDWREIWPLYALAVQSEPEKYEHLFATFLANAHELDDRLFRPQLACLRLAGVGSAPIPQIMRSVINWARDALSASTIPLLQAIVSFSQWERRLPDDIKSSLQALLSNREGAVRRLAVRALSVAVNEPEIRTALVAVLADEKADVRQAGVRALSTAVSDRLAREALVALLADSDERVRIAAVQVLVPALREQGVVEALFERLAIDEESVRGEVVKALAPTVLAQDYRERLLVLLRAEAAEMRRTAARALAAGASDPEVRGALIERLGDVEPEVRAAAAKALAPAVNHPGITTALVVLLKDGAARVRKAATEALNAAVGDRDVVVALLPGLGDEDDGVRAAAVRVLAEVRDTDVQARVIGRSDDPIWFVRLISTLMLDFNRGSNVQSALVARLKDPEPLVRQVAAWRLTAEARDPEVSEVLLAQLSDEVRGVRAAAARALAPAVSQPRVMAGLLALLSDTDGEVRAQAAGALKGAVAEAEVQAALVARLSEETWQVRKGAAQALRWAVDEAEVRTALVALLSDETWQVRKSAAQALATWIVSNKFGLSAAEVMPMYP